MKPVIVQKYGGSSVADIERIRHVAQHVTATAAKGYAVVVVVSAMGKTTDVLLEMAGELSSEPPRRELDMLLSVGERISMALLSIAINQLGHEAISFTGSQSGIMTTDSHSNARIIEVRPFRIQDELARNRIVIVAGYQGTSYKREITTLGRVGRIRRQWPSRLPLMPGRWKSTLMLQESIRPIRRLYPRRFVWMK